jgi:preprotein translocase subunit SecF
MTKIAAIKTDWNKFDITSKWRIFTAVSAGIMLIGLAVILFFGFNLGIDFKGGTNLDVEIGTHLTEDNFAEFEKIITDVLSDLRLNYTTPRKFYRSGELVGISLRFHNQAGEENKTATDAQLTIIRKLINDKRGEQATVGELSQIKDLLAGSPALSDIGGGKSDIEFVTYKGVYSRIYDLKYTGYTGLKLYTETVTAGYSSKLLENALLALAVALVLIMIYIVFRFELRSGIIAVVALFHNVLIMISLTAVLRIQINAPFVAAVITIVAYSINDIIVIFDRIRENKIKPLYKDSSYGEIANISIKENLTRTFNTFFTTIVTITILVIISVSEIQEFALPIMIGLVAGLFCSIFIAPSLWVLLENASVKNKEKRALKAKR